MIPRRLDIAWVRSGKPQVSQDANFHDLRHTYAGTCVKAGMPFVELQQRLGHDSITMTARYAIYQPTVTSTHDTVVLERMGMGQNVPTEIPTQKVA